MALEQIHNFGHALLAEDLDTSETVVTVTSGAVFATDGEFRVQVGTELMLVSAVAGNDLTVTRGIEGTTAATHTAGDPIDARLTAAGIVRIIQQSDIGRLVLADGIVDPPEPVWTSDGTDFIYEEDMD